MVLIQAKARGSKTSTTPTPEIVKSMDVGLGIQSIDLPYIKVQKRSSTSEPSSTYTDNPVHDDFDDGEWLHIG